MQEGFPLELIKIVFDFGINNFKYEAFLLKLLRRTL